MTAEKQMLEVFKNKTVVLFVPHQDDEVNVAGSLIIQLCKNNIKTYVVYLTNGDHCEIASKRMMEAEKALKVLGLKKEYIIFLGYPDIASYDDGCIYFTDSPNAYCSHAGHSSTYGDKRHKEYIYEKEGIHHKYNKENCIYDIKKIICDIKPDYIISNDFDNHVNHKELVLLLEEAIYEAVIENECYTPLWMKTYAYDLAFFAADDYTAYRLKRTQFFKQGENPTLAWTNRVCLPVPSCTRTKLISFNRLFAALMRHESQQAYVRASRVANSDKVFWIRRTDNVALKSQFYVTSGEKKYLNDFKYFGINDRFEIDSSNCWYPDEDDLEKKIHIDLERKIRIGSVRLYENLIKDSFVYYIKITLSNGEKIFFDDFKHDGAYTEIFIDCNEEVHWLEIRILKKEGIYAGFSEIEIYQYNELIPWFLKICIDNEYAYKHYNPQKNITWSLVAYDIYGHNISDKLENRVKTKFDNKLNESDQKNVKLSRKKIKMCVSFQKNDRLLEDEITLVYDSHIKFKEGIFATIDRLNKKIIHYVFYLKRIYRL